MSRLSEAVTDLSAEIADAMKVAECYSDGVTDTVDALENIHAALGALIVVATTVVENWDNV